MKRIRAMGLAAVLALALTAFIGAGSASAKIWVKNGYEVGADSYPTSFASNDSGTSLYVSLFGEPNTVKCHSGDMTVSGTITGLVPTQMETLPLSSAFSGCTATSSNFPTTVDMNDCFFSINAGGPPEAAYHLGYINCDSGEIELTTYYNQTVLCKVTLHADQHGIPSEAVNTEAGFQMWGESEQFSYTAVGGHCPEEGLLTDGSLYWNLDLQ